MNKVTKFFMAALLAGMCSFGYAQDYLSAPQKNEKVIGTVSDYKAACMSDPVTAPHNCTNATKLRWYETLLEKAKREFPGKVVDIRGMEVGSYDGDSWGGLYKGPAVGKVVEIGVGSPETQSLENLSKAMDKALRNVREGSRVAIDMVSVSGGISINREDFKDQVIDALLDKGYRVVAKDYLEKLYEEQKDQGSGIYNDKTTVQENNFSAVGYFINVKVTETSLRVQVVNVSTGEYEGNATVNF